MLTPPIDIQGSRFVDPLGRHVILRGVNLGGDSKYPWPDGGTHLPDDFAGHREVSFIGRPFPLSEADDHLARIAAWGFNTLRLLVTWEAVEHAGPGQHDEAYLDYLAEIARRAADFGFVIFIDVHQDVWSRMTGGDGAPGWVFEAVGLDFRLFHATGAAHVMQHRYDHRDPAARQESRYPMMSWACNYRLPANGIMWTAFFAGAALTPDWTVEGVNVQHFFQTHYLGAIAAVARRLADNPAVIGFGSMNEPSYGWLGQPMSTPQLAATREVPIPVRAGPCWTPFTALQAASGSAVRLPVLVADGAGGLRIDGEELANARGARLWLPGRPDPFAAAGAWTGSRADARVLDEAFFCRFDADRDAMLPFFQAVASTIRSVRGDWLLFGEMNPYQLAYGRGFPAGMPERTVNASHWYDVEILWRKRFDVPSDGGPLRDRYRSELTRLLGAADGQRAMPRLVGEFGIPYDLNGGEAFAAWARGERDEAIWKSHAAALAAMYDALDSLVLSSTQWVYTASNRNDLRIGDGWNQEDLSIFSADQLENGDGARARRGFSRPYVQRAQGLIRSMRFDGAGLEAEIEVDLAIAAPTEIFIPDEHFPGGINVRTDPPAEWRFDVPSRRLLIEASSAGRLTICVDALTDDTAAETAQAANA